jgi:hypothetical protein
MNQQQVLIRVPWSKVGMLIATLIKSARGGISKEESEELLEQLADVVAHLAVHRAADRD